MPSEDLSVDQADEATGENPRSHTPDVRPSLNLLDQCFRFVQSHRQLLLSNPITINVLGRLLTMLGLPELARQKHLRQMLLSMLNGYD